MTHDEVMALGLWWFQFSRERNVIAVPAYQGYVDVPSDMVAPLFIAVKPKQSYDSVIDGEWHSLPTTAVESKHFKWNRLRRISQHEFMERHAVIGRNVVIDATTGANVELDTPRLYWSDEQTVYLYPVPDATILVWFAYFRRLLPLMGDTDYNEISEHYPNVYVYGVLREVFTQQDKSRAVMDAERRFQNALRVMARANWSRFKDLVQEFQVSIDNTLGIVSPTNVITGYWEHD